MTLTAESESEATAAISADDPAETAQGFGLGSALRTIASLTTISRFTGLARDAVCSRIFGAGPIWSAFAFAFLLPNLFRRLFGEGALAAAFLPEYARTSDADPDKARIYAGAVIRVVTTWLVAATLLGEALLLALVLIGAGANDSLALRLAMITIPFTPMVCATAILGAMLQCHHRFGIPAAAPIVVNLCIISAATVWTWALDAGPLATIYAVAGAVIVSGSVQVVWSYAALGAHRPSVRSSAATVKEELKRTMRRMAPVVVGMSALQINTLIDGFIASWPILVGPTIALPFVAQPLAYPLDEASNSVLFFGQRLYHFPLGVFGIALATAVFPALSRAVNNSTVFNDTLIRGLRLSFFIGLPASVGLILVREPLIHVIYQGGAFSAEDASRTASVLLGYAPGVWAFALIHVYTRALYAHGDTKSPVRISLVAIAANTMLNLGLIWVLQEAALAWSTTVCAIGQCAALALLCRNRWGQGETGKALFLPIVRIIGASAAMAGVVIVLDAVVPFGATWVMQGLRLAVLVATGGMTFLIICVVSRAPELGWLLERKKPDLSAGLEQDSHES